MFGVVVSHNKHSSVDSVEVADEGIDDSQRLNTDFRSALPDFIGKDDNDIDIKLREMDDYAGIKYIIFPDDSFKLVWDIVILILLIYTATVTPFRVAFIDIDAQDWFTIDLIVDFLFLFDVLVNCLTAFYKDEENLVVDRTEIFISYLKTWMLIDILTSLPFSLILPSQYTAASRLGRLPKIYRLIKIVKLVRVMKFLRNKNKVLDFLECFSKISVGAERLLYFFLIFAGLVHIIACLWFLMSKISDDQMNWVVRYMIQDETIDSQYLSSFYWTITTLTTVGYGDIVPGNSTEMIFCIFIMLGGVFFYSYTIGTITSVIGQIEKRKSKLQSKILVLQDITKKYNLSKNFYKRIKSDLEYDQSKISKERNNMIANLPKKLATKLNYVINKKFIQDNKFFVEKPLEFITAVLRYLRPLRVKPKEIIYKKGDYSDEMFFVKTGELTYFEQHKSIDISFLDISDGDFFGDIEIFFTDLREFSVKAIKISEILCLLRDDLFNHILHNFELLKVPLILSAKKRRDLLDKEKHNAINEYLKDQNIVSENAQKIIDDQDNSELKSFKKKFSRLRNTLSPATRVILESGQSLDQVDELKLKITKLMKRYRVIEKYLEEKNDLENSVRLGENSKKIE